MRALALIDGEHYAPVVRSALEELPYEFVGAHLVGGIEKLRGEGEYGVPVFEQLHDALTVSTPEVVVDLSDEPVLGPRERMQMASRVLAHGLPYVGADFRFDPPVFEPFPLPSIGIVGTGKRVGKTAITVRAAQLLARERRVVVVAMGRGGPPEPELADTPPTSTRSSSCPARAAMRPPTISRRPRSAACPRSAAAAAAAGSPARSPSRTWPRAPGWRSSWSRSSSSSTRSGAALPPVETRRRVLVVNARRITRS